MVPPSIDVPQPQQYNDISNFLHSPYTSGVVLVGFDRVAIDEY